jgi:hypothetical protein
MYFIVPYLLNCIVLYWNVFCCIVQYCTVLYCIVLYCTVLGIILYNRRIMSNLRCVTVESWMRDCYINCNHSGNGRLSLLCSLEFNHWRSLGILQQMRAFYMYPIIVLYHCSSLLYRHLRSIIRSRLYNRNT